MYNKFFYEKEKIKAEEKLKNEIENFKKAQRKGFSDKWEKRYAADKIVKAKKAIKDAKQNIHEFNNASNKVSEKKLNLSNLEWFKSAYEEIDEIISTLVDSKRKLDRRRELIKSKFNDTWNELKRQYIGEQLYDEYLRLKKFLREAYEKRDHAEKQYRRGKKSYWSELKISKWHDIMEENKDRILDFNEKLNEIGNSYREAEKGFELVAGRKYYIHSRF